MKSFANDPSLDRVLLISREEMGGAAGGFDPLHPVYTQTEGADPFTYRNDFCHMRLLADGTMELTEFGRPARFAEEWRQLLSQLAACRTLTDLRIYDYDGDEPPMAAALTTYGRLLLYGNAGEYAPAAGWQGVARVFWDTDGFGALCEDEMFRAVGALSALDGIGEIEEAVGSALPGHCSPVAYLLQKNGTVTLFDRKNKSIQRPRERVQKIALVRYNPYGVSTWVALSKITGRFLCSEPRDSISADFFGGDYTDIIAPNRFRQKIADFAAVPRRYLAVLYQNGYLRVFGSGYHSGDILCEDVRGIELEGEELIAYLPADLSYAPAIDLEEPEDHEPTQAIPTAAIQAARKERTPAEEKKRDKKLIAILVGGFAAALLVVFLLFKFVFGGINDNPAAQSYKVPDVLGKTVEEALAISNKDVVDALGGLPAHKLHCSVLAEEAIKSAVKDYYDRNGIPYDHSQFPDCESCESCRMV